MKKSALLAVSALSLGVVGLATFTPVVNAVDSASTTATVIANVTSTLAIGNTEGNFGNNALNVTIDLKSNDRQEKSVTVRTLNNTGKDGTLALKATDNANLVGKGTASGSTINASPDEPTAGTAGWGFKGADSTYHQPSTSNTTVSNGDLQGDQETTVTFIAATDSAQMQGTYSTGVTYTMTVTE